MAGTASKLLGRAKNVRWLALYETARMVYGHGRRVWDNLEPVERERIGALVRKSKGRRANLSDGERNELWTLIKKAATG
ncbi:MAG: hypothetical protein E6G49_11575 [Actinobacteria bacterium]|nr:MAG: hypothetical protein E6G49_11575 [Actinomycetota bacterium]